MTRIMTADEVVVGGMGPIETAAELLRQGQVVAFPTETVYGLGADARSHAAVGRIYLAKGRPGTNPLIVHVSGVEAAKACVRGFPEKAFKLAEKFWPGPLTLVLPRAGVICAMVSAGLDTVAIRCPNHPVAQALLRAFGWPIAAPSANRSGFASPTTAQHVFAELNGRIPFILDAGRAGACTVGVESTVLDLSGAEGAVPTILRPGGVTKEMIEAVIGPVATFQGQVAAGAAAASPGMLTRHYAPRTAAFRIGRGEWDKARAWAAGKERVVLMTHDPALALGPPHETMVMPADPAAYARELYAALRAADGAWASSILVLMPDTEEGMWAAVADRLRRATEPLPVM